MIADEAAPHVVALFGPTGVGKTDVAVELADLVRGRGEDPVAVSADALQVYEGLGTLTGAPSPAQL
ncbi:MAG: isopentenyl transferase family protein, partial [Gaiellaceae bacterium]